MPVRSESMAQRIMRVLECFGVGEISLTASEIARRANLPVSSAHRIVGDLVTAGMLERDSTNKVRIGIRLWGLATRASGLHLLRDLALPFMDELQSVVRHHTQLSVLDRNDVLYLEKLSSRRTVAANIAGAGTRLPVLSCATGIVLIAFSPLEVQERILSNTKMTAFTERTVVDRDELRRLVDNAKRQGYFLAAGWIHPDTTGLAVPIVSSEGDFLAALSVTTPPRPEAELLALLPALNTAARNISRAISSHQRIDPRLNLLKQQIRRASSFD